MKKRRVASVRNMSKEDKRRLQLNKRLDEKTIEEKRVKFARPSDSKLFVKTNGSEAVHTPLNKRLIAIILAIVMVVGLIPAGIFMLRPKAAGNGLEAVEMSVRVNGADDFATATIPGGEISKTVQDAEYSIALPDSFLYRKAVVIDSSDNSETEIFSAGRLGNKTYYSLNENSATGTLLNNETQRLVLVLAEKYNVTLNYNDADGDASTSAIDGTYIWGGDSLRVQGTPKTDREVSSITYSINGGATTATSVSNNGTTIPASSITGDIAVNVNFGAVDKYSITEVDNDNHGGLTTGTTINDKSGANPVSPGGTASFYIYSQSNTGGSDFVFNMLSINGVDATYPVEKGEQYKTETAFRSGKIYVTLVETDTALNWNNNGTERNYGLNGKHRSLYLVEVTDVHEPLNVAFHFKQKADRQIMIKGLRGIQETGATTESRSNVTKYIHLDQVIDDSGWLGVGVPVRNYRFVKNENNFYSAYYNQDIGGNFSGSIPSNNVYFYRVKPGYNPYSVAGTNVYAQYFDDNGQLISTVPSADLLAGDSSADRPDVVIQKASVAVTAGAQEAVRNDLGRLADWEVVNTFFVWLYEKLGAFDSEIRYWGTSDNLTNGDVAQAKENSDYVWNSARDLALTTIQTEEQDPSIRWYAIALNQNAANNQQLYVNADLYQYYLRLDLGTGGSLANSSDRFNASGSVLTEKDAYKHTVDDREKYITFPAETPTNSNGSVIFGGWRAIDANGDPILRNGEEVIYQSLEQIKFDWQNLSYSYGKDTGKDSDVNQVLAFEAVWRDLRTANITTISVETWAEVPEGTPGAVSKEIPSDDGIVTKYYQQIENKREIQPVGQETLILNYPEPENAQFYELNTTISVLDNVPEQQSTIEQIPEDNQFRLYYDLAYEDLTVTKQVLGNPTQLSQGFPITITITKPNGAPLDADEALDFIEFSNGDKNSATVNGNSITYTKTFGRSDTVMFSNVPHGWTITISEPKAATSTSGTPDYETTITSNPEGAGEQAEEPEGYTGPTTWNGVLNNDTHVTVTNKSDSYLVLDKNISRNDGGKYDLTLEAYTTGDVTKEKITEKVPTDFIVVVDQSGSMDTADMPTGDPTVQEDKYLEDIAAGQYYYREEVIDEEGNPVLDPETQEQKVNYYRVYGVKDYLYRYYPANYWFTGDIVEHLGADIGWFMSETDATTNIDNAFYFREEVGGQTYYIPIRTTIQGKIGTYVMRFQFPSKQTGSTYKFDREVTTYSSNGNSPWYKNVLNGDVMSSGSLWATANSTVQGLYPNDDEYTYSTINLLLARPRTGMYINYPMYGRHLSYTKLCYRDVNGVEHEVPSDSDSNGRTTWEYCDDDGIARTTDSVTSARPTYDGLYTFPGTTDRISALKAALTRFAGDVAKETDDFGKVDNRISIVGFSSSGYNNTELLTHTERDIASGSTNGWQKGTADNNVSEYYGKALVASTQGDEVGVVNPKITRAIDAITANGGTQPEDGLNMAYKILQNRGDKKYIRKAGPTQGQEEDRNTMVIFFTDGQPGDYHYSNQYAEANEVVAQAKLIKDYKVDSNSTRQTSLFSIGVFGESDANPLTYADTTQSQSNRQAWKYLGGWMETYYSDGTYYCLRRQWRPNSSDGYTTTANDTIYDYMSVVSSNYPDAKNYIAPTWLTGGFQGNYIDATDGDAVRQKSTAESTNKYYRLASSQDTLVAAFESVISLDTEESSVTTIGLDANSILKDVINSNDFVIPDDPSQTLTVKMYTVKGTLPTPQSTEIVWEREDESDETSPEIRTEITDPNNYSWSEDGTTLNVKGFDYGSNYIAYDKDPIGDTGPNQGKKLIVVISGLEPKATATGELKSNTTDSGIYKVIGTPEEPELQMIDSFPVPQMYRYAYNLRESGVKVDDEFDIGFTRNGNGTDGIMVTYPNGNREADNLQNGEYTWEDAVNNDAIYFETFDEGAYLAATVPSTRLDQETYDYSVSLIDMTGTTPESFDNDFDITEDSSTIHVSNVSNSRTVIIKEFTRGVEGEADYSDKEKEFPIQVKLTKADGETLVNDPITATIVRKDDPEHPREEVLHFERNNGVVEIELADGDYITFDTLKNYKITVWEGESDHEGYIDSYAPDENGAEIGTGVIVVDDDNNNNVIEVINRLEQNPDVDSGVVDSNNPSKVLFAILAALGGLVAIGAGIFLWKKKDEFVEQ